MKKRFLLALFFAMLAALGASRSEAASAKDQPQPPAGIVATTATLDQVMSAHDKAVGPRTWTTDIEDGQISEYGLKGTYHDVYSHADYKSTTVLGPLRWEYGRVDGQRWRRNLNGILVQLHDLHRRDEVNEEAMSSKNRDANKDIKLIGEVSAPVAAYVVQLTLPGGRPEWLFYDKKTYLIDRAEAQYPDGRVVFTFSDFHQVHGINEAWRVHVSDGHSANDSDIVTTSDRYDVPVDAAELAMPPGDNALMQYPAGVHAVTIPVRIIDGDIVVRVNVGERGLDFILDSGSSGIVFDSGISQQLNLQTVGESVQTTAGTYVRTNAIVPDLRIGDIHLKNVIVDSLPFRFNEDLETKVVGLLGFDFIANASLAVDYQHNQLIATEPGYFVPPSDAYALDALWDDGVPFVTAQIGDAVGNHFILDTGSYSGLVFSSFVQAHPADIKDQGLGRAISTYVPFVDFEGVGGIVETKPTQVKNFQLGGVNFREWLIFQTTANHAFEGEDTDGLVGYDFLKYFTVYLDYHDAHVYLVPNDLFKHNSTR